MTMQFEKKQFKQIQTHSQSGRSMIEMLGVLAIIAILSIGGIVGYKLAMNYYQADQIANEINLMHNDLKVKYALGNEELILGDPYDDTPENEDYTGHLSTQYDRYPVDYDCIRKDKAEFYNCREADAYYIKVGNVSKGVCKPLTMLLNGMDGLMYMEINKQPYKEDDLCTSDEANEFYIQFDAEEVNGNYDSNRPEGWCADDEDCDTSRPICDIENNECVECIENADCKDSSRPRCNVEQGNCESCPLTTPKWNGNACVECTADDDCADTPDTPKCNINTNKCVQCLTYNDCTDTPDTPNCNTGTNTCEPCPSNSFWDGEKCQEGCRENSHCAEDEYCYKLGGFSCTDEWEDAEDFSGSCRKVNDDLIFGTVDGQTYYGSKNTMNWWSVKRFCEAAAQLGHGNGQMAVWGKPDFKCNPSVTLTSLTSQYCHKNGGDVREGDFNDLSTTVEELRKMFGVTHTGEWDAKAIDIWLNNKDSCQLFEIEISTPSNAEHKAGYIMYNRESSHLQAANHALCQP